MVAPEEHRTQEQRASWPDDMALRAAGFTIHDRAEGQEPIWTRSGHLYHQHVAVLMAKGGIEDDADS